MNFHLFADNQSVGFHQLQQKAVGDVGSVIQQEVTIISRNRRFTKKALIGAHQKVSHLERKVSRNEEKLLSLPYETTFLLFIRYLRH
jgi:hypothetical protein